MPTVKAGAGKQNEVERKRVSHSRPHRRRGPNLHQAGKALPRMRSSENDKCPLPPQTCCAGKQPGRPPRPKVSAVRSPETVCRRLFGVTLRAAFTRLCGLTRMHRQPGPVSRLQILQSSCRFCQSEPKKARIATLTHVWPPHMARRSQRPDDCVPTTAPRRRYS